MAPRSRREYIRARATAVYNEAARKNQQLFGKLLTLAYSSTKAAALMLVAAIVALVIANTPAVEVFHEITEFDLGFFVFGQARVAMPLAEIINDIFMAIFFLLVGLEIKYEMTVGELTNIRQALLPIIAAAGGVLAPIVIYSIFNAMHPGIGSLAGASPRRPISRSRSVFWRCSAIACPTACACSYPR